MVRKDWRDIHAKIIVCFLRLMAHLRWVWRSTVKGAPVGRQEESPFEEGAVMHDIGYPLSDNPYSRGTPDFLLWIQGWRQAEKDRNRA